MDTMIDVKDIVEEIGQYNFSNKKQIELLQTVNFIIYKKNYPEDLSGIIDKKIELLKQEELKMAVGNTNLKLSSKKGAKVNFIRIINCLCELAFFTDTNGNEITKKEVFKTFGYIINQDFSTFQNDLSSTKSAANSDMKNTLAIFEQMYAKQQEINQK